jgi:hypothetical protein
MAGYLGVGLISLAVFAVVVVLLGIASGSWGRSTGGPGQTYALPSHRRPSAMNQGPPVSPRFTQQHLTGYHGTSLGNALDIYRTGLWLIGPASPRGVYIGDTVDIARQYAGSSGGIVVIDIDPGVQLTDRGGGIYVCEVPGVTPNHDYYRIEGLLPVGVLSPRGERIR